MGIYTLYYGTSDVDAIYSINADVSYDHLLESLETFLRDWYQYPSPNACSVSQSALRLMVNNLVYHGYCKCYVRNSHRFVLHYHQSEFASI